MIIFENINECSGCSACMESCPKQAISMKSDEEGFLYPSINKDLCIDCGICKKICPFQNRNINDDKLEVPIVYAVKNISDEVRMKSASGGVFTAISDYVLSKSGVIYGVKYDNELKVIHSRATTNEERDEFRGSKYVQSNIEGIFNNVRKDLEDNKHVMFVGTPCQVAGLGAYLKKDYKKLIKCDIVCHGTPSPRIYNDYINYMEKKHGTKISNLCFRDKEQGWINQKWKIDFIDGKSFIESDDLKIYRKIFYKHFAHRPSCHNCKFTNLARPSDFTLGDFWGIDKVMPEFIDSKGVSLLLVNTNKGLEIFNEINNLINYKQSDCNNCIQPQLKYPTEASKNREKFWNDYNKHGFNYIAKKYGSDSNFEKIKMGIKKIIKK